MVPAIIDAENYSKYLFDCLKRRPKHVVVATHGIYAGIDWRGCDTCSYGPDYQLATRDMLELMRPLPDVRFLVGLSTYRSCKGQYKPCLDCESKYAQSMFRLLNHADFFSEIKWRVTVNSHPKCCLFFYEKEVCGIVGRNFSDTDWGDVVFTVGIVQVKQLFAKVNQLWNEACPVTTEHIERILSEQEITKRAIDSLVAGA